MLGERPANSRMTAAAPMYHLTSETPQDSWEVEALFDLCFAPGRTALSSYRLRDDVPPGAALCQVARDDLGFLAGAIRYWPVTIPRAWGRGWAAR